MQNKSVSVEYVKEYIEELIACEALELIPDVSEQRTDIYIPYMMNDAVEVVFVMENCKMQGELPEEIPVDTLVQSVRRENDRHGLVLRLQNGHTITIWFERCQQKKALYQYHRIGHFWKKGQEQWRQLVYMIGTIFDKYVYLGEEFCNEEEQQLMWLITFAPFRYWSPVKEDLESRYPNSLRGICCMMELAEQAEDQVYGRMLRCYRWLVVHEKFGRLTAAYEKRMARALNEPKHADLYQVILERVQSASEKYGCRDYGEEQNHQIEQKRREVECYLKEKGFSGSYPKFERGTVKIIAMEEHPFTCLEWESFVFRIQLMVSKTKQQESGDNRGFFCGCDRSGEIICSERNIK